MSHLDSFAMQYGASCSCDRKLIMAHKQKTSSRSIVFIQDIQFINTANIIVHNMIHNDTNTFKLTIANGLPINSINIIANS